MAAMPSWWLRDRESYGGLEIHCAPGVHAAAAEMLSHHGVSRTGVLDLGSGSGAFLARLRDAGYSDLHAVERERSRFRLAGVEPMTLDLEQDFAGAIGRKFGLVTAIEIIEHLDSPVRFINRVVSLLEPGGHLLLSTPNIAELKSRLKFLLKGEMRYFGVADYRYQRHISPILPGLLPSLLAEAGMQLIAQTSAGSFDGYLKRTALCPVSLPFGRASRGDCLLVLCRKGN